jgi:small subunit ribosomal protein S8
MTDPIADMLTRIRNAVAVQKADVMVPFSHLKENIATILVKEGFIASSEKVANDLRLVLKYKHEQPVIRSIDRISKPGRRVYYSYKELPRTLPTLGVMIISTSKGLMTNTEAKQSKVGGELLCEIS